MFERNSKFIMNDFDLPLLPKYRQNSLTVHKKIKENSVYIWKTLINIFDNDGRTDNLAKEYFQQIMSGKLLHTVLKTDSKTAAKLKALVLALDDPENRKKFMNSRLCSAISVFRNGAAENLSTSLWSNYKPTAQNTSFKSAINTALISYKDDPKAQIGLNMGALLDTIIKEENGQYVLTNISAHDADELIRTIEDCIREMRQTEKFAANFQREDDQENY